MKRQTFRIDARFAVISGATLALTVPCLAQRFRMVEFENGGFPLAYCFALNDRGELVGSVATVNDQYPAAWRGPVPALLPSPGGGRDVGNVLDVSNVLQAGGVVANRGAYWDARSGLAHEVHPPDAGNSQIEGINEAGLAVGWSYDLSNGYAGFMWRGGEFTDLGSLRFPKDVNELEQIVGSGDGVSYLYEDGVLTELAPLAEGQSTQAWAINDFGVIVGDAFDADGNRHGVIWNDGRLIDIGSVTPGAQTWARSINNDGLVVGGTTPGVSGRGAAVIWTRNLLMELNDLADVSDLLRYAEDINEANQIAVRTHETTSVRLDPSPGGVLLVGFEPAEVGRTNRLIVSGATPGSRVIVIYGPARGPSFISFPGCENLPVEISNPQLAGVSVARANGTALLSVFVPASALGQRVVLQAIDAQTCDRSPPAFLYLQR